MEISNEHPAGMIDLTKVEMSIVMDETTKLFINERLKGEGVGKLKRNHHVLIVVMGEK